MNRIELDAELIRAGKETIHCKKRCYGIRNSIEDGVLSPPAIISGLGDKINCVIISLAPPKTNTRNQKLLVTRDYGDLRKRCRRKLEFSAFYLKLDAFRNKLGLKGAAVWTTLCKCERIKGQRLSPETIQTCSEKHLARELELVDKSVPVVAVGNRVFNAVRQSFPDRFVLNVPSPDGTRGDFQKTADNKRLLEFAKARMAEGRPGALCLCPPCARKHLSADDA